jgi:hypothetical protein
MFISLSHNFLTDFNAEHNAFKYLGYNLYYEGEKYPNIKTVSCFKIFGITNQIPKAGFVQRMLESKFTNFFLEQHHHMSMKHGP